MATNIEVPPGSAPRPAVFTSTEAKNSFGEVLERALRDGMVVITKHDQPKAVLVSLDEWNAVLGKGRKLDLDALGRRFDDMVARMNAPEGARAMERAFEGSPAKLAKAAAAASRKRGKAK